MPTAIPYLTAADMCHHVYKDGDRCCLLGHVRRIFANHSGWPGPATQLAIDSLRRAIPDEDGGISTYNDSHTLQENADTWNRAFGLSEPPK